MKIPYFPWRLLRRYSLISFLFLNLCNVLALGLASEVFNFSFFEAATLWWMFSFAIASIPVAIGVAFLIVNPLRRVILKAYRIASKKQMAQLLGAERIDENDESLFESSEPGGFAELEEALNRIYRKLKKRRTQLAHEREESQVLMSSLTDAVVSLNLNGEIVFSNTQFVTDFFRRELVGEASAIPLKDVLPDEEVMRLFQEVQRHGDIQRISKKLNTFMDGEKYFSITISPLRERGSREIYGTMGLFHDITEIKRAEKIRIEFVENASHELRTPLTSVKGFLSTLKEDIEAGRMEQVPHFLNILTRSVDRLADLVNDMMSLAALEHNSPLKMEAVDVSILTQEVLTRLSPLAADKKILLTFLYAPEATPSQPLLLEADPEKLEQVLVNLVSNAIKYIPANGRVDVMWDLDEQKNVVLRVKDNGPGIPQDHQARLFERFYRVDRARSREVGGTGLGLAIVKHVMVSHGGHVGVRSEVGLGSEFYCVFPAQL